MAADLGLAAGVTASPAVAAGDVNKDGFTDFFFGGPKTARLALSDGRGRFEAAPAPSLAEAEGGRAALFLDVDDDGLLDLVVAGEFGLRALRNMGRDFKRLRNRGRHGTAGLSAGRRPRRGRRRGSRGRNTRRRLAGAAQRGGQPEPLGARGLDRPGEQPHRHRRQGRAAGGKPAPEARDLRRRRRPWRPTTSSFGLGRRDGGRRGARDLDLGHRADGDRVSPAASGRGPDRRAGRDRARPQALVVSVPLRVERPGASSS